MPKKTELSLLRGLLSDDVQVSDRAFREIYLNYYPIAERYILQNSGTSEDAKDIFQEAVVALYKNLHREKFTLTTSLRNYLISIVRKLWLYRLREGRRKRLGMDYTNLADPVKPIDEIDEDVVDLAVVCRELLEQMDEACVTVLTKFYFQKQSMKQIAEAMKYSSAQVAKNKKMRCINKLRRMLEQYMADNGIITSGP